MEQGASGRVRFSTLNSQRSTFLLAALAGAQAALYLTILGLSRQFVVGEGFEERPIIAVLALFAACFSLYVGSLALAVRMREGRRLVGAIVVAAIAFRAILLFSSPIQEIDIYRYLWDGAVAAHGISPYRYAPADVLAADSSSAAPQAFRQLVALRDAQPALAEILGRIHYAELTTVYPPVSQAVFAIAHRLTPPEASVSTRVTLLKGLLLVFDVATIALVWLLLQAAGKHSGWLIAYAWCPLVMKEFANSGHLDAIAVCFTTAAVWWFARDLYHEARAVQRWPAGAAVLLGLAIGAKLYAVVLLPLLTAVTWARRGRAPAVGFAFAALAIAGTCLTPMLMGRPARGQQSGPTSRQVGAQTDALGVGVGSLAASSPRPGPESGLTAFLSRWEMNDFLFMLVVENVRPQAESDDGPAVWFAVVPDSWRRRVIAPVRAAWGLDAGLAAFLSARIFMSAVFLGIALLLLLRALRRQTVTDFLEAAFLTLAWFWLLLPTGNPWYWTWALPLLPFARGKVWLAVSGLVLVYYLRFWLQYHWPDEPVLGTPYRGLPFFDFVVTWIEYGPWYVWLASGRVRKGAGE